MKNSPIYLNDWIKIHPYQSATPTDEYFVKLARELYKTCIPCDIPAQVRIKSCLYTAAYLEDQISGLGLWQGFTSAHKSLYGTYLPFYPTNDTYVPDEINTEDICFIIWNTWQKTPLPHPYIHPLHPDILTYANHFQDLLNQAYKEAPANSRMEGFFNGYKHEEEGEKKLAWLFGHTYLTEPSMLPYIENVSSTDKYIIPTGPLALFLHEWIERLCCNQETWKGIKGLFIAPPSVPESIRTRNQENYHIFTSATQGSPIVYLDGYEKLHRFLVNSLGWPDDENHTLPQMKPYRNFVLMTNPEKGILLAKDICECIADSKNPLYAPAQAKKQAFRLLTEEALCPPDLLIHCIRNGYLPDACIPGDEKTKALVKQNADFIARHSLLYYYRGD